MPPGVRLWRGERNAAGWAWQPEAGVEPGDSWPASICCQPEVPPYQVAVAARFVEYLISHREARDLIPGIVRACTFRPSARPGMVMIPHLATLIDATGCTRDHVIWESLDESRFDIWLGESARPDLAWIADHLPGLLALRAEARCGLLGSTDDERALISLIASRFLSIRAVCQNESLFRRLLTG